MIRSLLIVVLLSVAALHGADDNGFRNAKVGDWIEYQCTYTMPIFMNKKDGEQSLQVFNYVAKYIVTAKTETKATVLSTVRYEDGKTKAEEHIYYVDITKPFKRFETDDEPDEIRNADMEILDKGSEKLTFKGKVLQATWIKSQTPPWPSVSKIWKSSDVPMQGTVKVEAISTFGDTKSTYLQELKDFGSSK